MSCFLVMNWFNRTRFKGFDNFIFQGQLSFLDILIRLFLFHIIHINFKVIYKIKKCFVMYILALSFRPMLKQRLI